MCLYNFNIRILLKTWGHLLTLWCSQFRFIYKDETCFRVKSNESQGQIKRLQTDYCWANNNATKEVNEKCSEVPENVYFWVGFDDVHSVFRVKQKSWYLLHFFIFIFLWRHEWLPQISSYMENVCTRTLRCDVICQLNIHLFMITKLNT